MCGLQYLISGFLIVFTSTLHATSENRQIIPFGCSDVVCEHSRLFREDKMAIVDKMNEFRNSVAGSLFPQFPHCVGNMQQVIWDEKLGQSAQLKVNTCPFVKAYVNPKHVSGSVENGDALPGYTVDYQQEKFQFRRTSEGCDQITISEFSPMNWSDPEGSFLRAKQDVYEYISRGQMNDFWRMPYRGKSWRIMFRRVDATRVGCGYVLKMEKRNKHFQLKSYLTCIYCSYNMTMPFISKAPCFGCVARDSVDCIDCRRKRHVPNNNNHLEWIVEKNEPLAMDANDKYKNLCSGENNFFGYDNIPEDDTNVKITCVSLPNSNTIRPMHQIARGYINRANAIHGREARIQQQLEQQPAFGLPLQNPSVDGLPTTSRIPNRRTAPTANAMRTCATFTPCQTVTCSITERTCPTFTPCPTVTCATTTRTCPTFTPCPTITCPTTTTTCPTQPPCPTVTCPTTTRTCPTFTPCPTITCPTTTTTCPTQPPCPTITCPTTTRTCPTFTPCPTVTCPTTTTTCPTQPPCPTMTCPTTTTVCPTQPPCPTVTCQQTMAPTMMSSTMMSSSMMSTTMAPTTMEQTTMAPTTMMSSSMMASATPCPTMTCAPRSTACPTITCAQSSTACPTVTCAQSSTACPTITCAQSSTACPTITCAQSSTACPTMTPCMTTTCATMKTSCQTVCWELTANGSKSSVSKATSPAPPVDGEDSGSDKETGETEMMEEDEGDSASEEIDDSESASAELKSISAAKKHKKTKQSKNLKAAAVPLMKLENNGNKMKLQQIQTPSSARNNMLARIMGVDDIFGSTSEKNSKNPSIVADNNTYPAFLLSNGTGLNYIANPFIKIIINQY